SRLGTRSATCPSNRSDDGCHSGAVANAVVIAQALRSIYRAQQFARFTLSYDHRWFADPDRYRLGRNTWRNLERTVGGFYGDQSGIGGAYTLRRGRSTSGLYLSWHGAWTLFVLCVLFRAVCVLDSHRFLEQLCTGNRRWSAGSSYRANAGEVAAMKARWHSRTRRQSYGKN